jgi:hypothetical protein
MTSRQQLCKGDCRLVSAVVRDMAQADDGELAGIQAVVTDLLGKYERRMGSELVIALCRWSEAAGRHLKTRQETVLADDLTARRRRQADG